MWSGPAYDGLNFAWREADKFGHLALRVLFEDLDQTGDEEFLLLCGAGLPVVRLREGDCEANLASPLLQLRFFGAARSIKLPGLDGAEVVQVPGLAYRKCAVAVFPRLVQADSASVLDRHDNHPFFIRRWRVWRVGRLRVLRILCYTDMGDVRLGHCAFRQFVNPATTRKKYVRAPVSSGLMKRLSMMRAFSSSKRSARVMLPFANAEGGGERLACGGIPARWSGRIPEAGPLGRPPPRGNLFIPSIAG
jgi:hypothetical protein